MDTPLGAYLRKHGIEQGEFARLSGLPQPMISMWLSGKRSPGLESAFAIEKATGGEVPASAWVGLAAKPNGSKRRKRKAS